MEITTKPFFFLFFFFSFFLHTWLYLLMTPALIMLVVPGLPSYNRVEVYYLKGVIGLPIVISFRDGWYTHIFFLGNGLIDDVIVIGWTDSDFKISRALLNRFSPLRVTSAWAHTFAYNWQMPFLNLGEGVEWPQKWLHDQSPHKRRGWVGIRTCNTWRRSETRLLMTALWSLAQHQWVYSIN